MNREQAISVARGWLAKQPSMFRYRWHHGPRFLGDKVFDEDRDFTPAQLEQILDVVRDVKTGKIKEKQAKRAIEVLLEGIAEELPDFDPDAEKELMHVALRILSRTEETDGWYPYEIANAVEAMLYGELAEETRPILEAALQEAKKPPTVRESIEGSWQEVLEHAALTDRVLNDPTASAARVRDVIGSPP